MKLWKRTVALMLITLLCSLIPVGVLSLYVTGKRSLNNAAETYGRQLTNGKNLLEQFWDSSKYEQMSETGKKSYLEFQFLRCCGEEMILINSESKNSQEPGYADGSNEMVIDSVTMDRIGVPLLTIDARDGSVVQRVQNGPSSGTFPGGVGECE